MDDLLRLIRRCWCSFSSSSISTSFISSLTFSSGFIPRASSNILAPNIKNKAEAKKFVIDFGTKVGTAWPKTADKTVMTSKAEKAAEKTTRRGCRIAIRAATRNVLSPISEKIIMVNDRISECNGEIISLASSGSDTEGELGLCVDVSELKPG